MTTNDTLMRDLVVGVFADLRSTTDALIANWEQRALSAEAELSIVRERLERLLDGDFMPTTAAIERALYVSSVDIAERAMPEVS